MWICVHCWEQKNDKVRVFVLIVGGDRMECATIDILSLIGNRSFVG